MRDERALGEAALKPGAAATPDGGRFAADVLDWSARHLPAAGLVLTPWQQRLVLQIFGGRARP
ncbi:hypothetical protein [Streptomyces pseudovenezuelae]|uniref:hypothetical protein n=1 Tax=Streptomyces pseudovenezuelae TaxID=67350 RepID=UPI0036E434F5